MKRTFGTHHLAFLGTLNEGQGDLLAQAVQTAKRRGCTLFELACNPINQMSANETADALQKGGITEAAYCRFFSTGDLGNPIGTPSEVVKALETLHKDFEFISTLRANGIRVEHMTGPSCFVLGLRPRKGTKVRERIVKFYKRLLKQVPDKLTINIEYLRPGEDEGVIGDMPEACRIIDDIGDERIKIHGDTFHMRWCAESPHQAILQAGSRLGYLHAHGDNRVAAGAFMLDGLQTATDAINWHAVSCALDHIGYIGPIVCEPFGQTIRDEIPALGESLPPAIDAERYLGLTYIHFQKMGIL